VKELRDYSADFDPNLRLEDFSKDILVGLLKLYSRLLVALDGLWYLSVKERTGNDEAMTCDKWVWERALRYMTQDMAELIKVSGKDVVDFMKVLQARPLHLVIEEKMKVINRNDVVLTVTHCPTLKALEKEGEEREGTHCDQACAVMRRKHAELFNPDMEVVCLKLPPRKGDDDICCQWEYRLEEGSSAIRHTP
jgi:hypothetical protein